jgi:hypothetical protein
MIPWQADLYQIKCCKQSWGASQCTLPALSDWGAATRHQQKLHHTRLSCSPPVTARDAARDVSTGACLFVQGRPIRSLDTFADDLCCLPASLCTKCEKCNRQFLTLHGCPGSKACDSCLRLAHQKTIVDQFQFPTVVSQVYSRTQLCNRGFVDLNPSPFKYEGYCLSFSLYIVVVSDGITQ